MTLVVFIAAAMVLAVCLLLVLHRDYHAGLFGNLGLGLIALAAATRLAGILEFGSEVRITPLGVLLWTGLALFLGRHAAKFIHRWRAGGSTWYPGCTEVRHARPAAHCDDDVVRLVP